MTSIRLYAALKAATVHLAISAGVAALAGWLVFAIWFPYPYRSLAGGEHLFWILIGVDVVCGPLLTAIVFDPRKPRRELTLDLGLIATVQLAALAYGLHSIALARPVALAFEVDRFVAVAAADVDASRLVAGQTLSWRGPDLTGTREPRDGNETMHSIELSLQGLEPSARPDWWQPYDQSRQTVRQRMKKLAKLRARAAPGQQAVIDQTAAATGLPLDTLHYLPMTSRKMLDGWIVLLDVDANPVGYAPVDGF